MSRYIGLFIFYIAFILLFEDGFCQESGFESNSSQLFQYENNNYLLRVSSNVIGAYVLFEAFSKTCFTWIRINCFHINTKDTDIFFKISKDYSVIHLSDGTDNIRVIKKNGNKKKITPVKSFTIIDTIAGCNTFAYLINNKDINDFDKIFVFEYVYDNRNYLVEHTYLKLPLIKRGIIYNNFVRFLNSSFLRGLIINTTPSSLN